MIVGVPTLSTLQLFVSADCMLIVIDDDGVVMCAVGVFFTCRHLDDDGWGVAHAAATAAGEGARIARSLRPVPPRSSNSRSDEAAVGTRTRHLAHRRSQRARSLILARAQLDCRCILIESPSAEIVDDSDSPLLSRCAQ